VQTEAGIAETPDQVFTTAAVVAPPTPTPVPTVTPEPCETRKAFLRRQVKRAKGARIRSAVVLRGKRVVRRQRLTEEPPRRAREGPAGEGLVQAAAEGRVGRIAQDATGHLQALLRAPATGGALRAAGQPAS
jgi:hypothetical protein